MMNQPIYVLDEPSSNLDARSIELLADIVRHWKETGRTVLVADHRLGYLEGIVDRVVVLEKGGVKADLDGDLFYALAPEELARLGLRNPRAEGCIESGHSWSASPNVDAIRVTNMSFSYRKDRNGVHISSAEFPAGGVIAVVGKNGAGKSTLLRCLCGLNRKCSGYLEVGGKKYKLSKPSGQAYMVMQNTGNQLFAESVEQEVSSCGTKNADIDDILSALDLTELSERHPLSLSGGQQQRVAIASALASGRKLLLLDEPTSGLDHQSMREVALSIKEASARGHTTIVVTHDREFMSSCCTHYTVLNEGELSKVERLDDIGVSRLNATLDAVRDDLDIARCSTKGW